MGKTIYLEINQNNIVNHEEVKLSDIAKVCCDDKVILQKVKNIKILDIKPKNHEKTTISALDIIQIIKGKLADFEVVNLGEKDCLIEYEKPEKKNTIANTMLNFIKVFLVCVLVFFGSAYAIIAYNNDVGTTEIFDKIYGIIEKDRDERDKSMEIMYSLGLTLGIIIFYNHFLGKKFNSDPTPIETEMNSYEKQLDETLIQRGQRGKK